MIPEFPLFKPIEFSDKAAIEEYTKKYAPYSDFNFISMWSWDVHEAMEFSCLNGNLVVKFNDYITGAPFYSFFGECKVSETVETLLEYSRQEGLDIKLQLIPEIAIQHLDNTKFKSEEVRDHFDYILDLELLSTFENSKLRGHASFNRRFFEEHCENVTTKIMDLNDEANRALILKLTERWAQNKISENKDLLPHLEDAVRKFFLLGTYDTSISAVGIFHTGKLIAFIINELLPESDYCICHFMKADNSFKGIYSHLVAESSKVLLATGKKYTNFEQDLGLKNLRQSKKTYHPIDFLKKYIVTYI